MSFQDSTLSQTPFRAAVHEAYRQACLAVNPDDPHHLGDDPRETLISYQKKFGKKLGSCPYPVSFAEVMDVARRSQVVYVGDFHPLRTTKDMFLHIVEEGAHPGSRRIVLLEEFLAKFNRYLKAYLSGALDVNGLRSKAWRYDRNGSWGGVLSILDYAKEKEHDTQLYGIDVAKGDDKRIDPLAMRTRGIAEQVEQYFHGGEQIFVLAGELHLAADKLPTRLKRKVESFTTIFQYPDELFWQLLPQGLAYGTEAVLTSTGVYCLNTSKSNPLFRALAYSNAELSRKDLGRHNKRALEVEYNQALLNVLMRALTKNANGLGSIDPAKVPVEDLERLVYGTDDKKTVRAKLEEWIPLG